MKRPKEKGAKGEKVTEGESQLPLSNPGIETEVKSRVTLRFRNLLWPWIERCSAAQSHVQYVQSSLTTATLCQGSLRPLLPTEKGQPLENRPQHRPSSCLRRWTVGNKSMTQGPIRQQDSPIPTHSPLSLSPTQKYTVRVQDINSGSITVTEQSRHGPRTTRSSRLDAPARNAYRLGSQARLSPPDYTGSYPSIYSSAQLHLPNTEPEDTLPSARGIDN